MEGKGVPTVKIIEELDSCYNREVHVVEIQGKEYVRKTFKDCQDVSFMNNVKVARRLPPHENVLLPHEFYIHGGKGYLLMEKGIESLSDYIEDHGEDMLPVWKDVTRQVFSAICHLHDHGFCHSDIRPSNFVVMEDDGPFPKIKMIDFDDCFMDGECDSFAGTLIYNSPELILKRDYFQPADVWSAFVTSFRILTGGDLFEYLEGDQDETLLPNVQELMYILTVQEVLGELPGSMQGECESLYSFLSIREGKGVGLKNILMEDHNFVGDIAEYFEEFFLRGLQYEPENRVTMREALCLLDNFLV